MQAEKKVRFGAGDVTCDQDQKMFEVRQPSLSEGFLHLDHVVGAGCVVAEYCAWSHVGNEIPLANIRYRLLRNQGYGRGCVYNM